MIARQGLGSATGRWLLAGVIGVVWACSGSPRPPAEPPPQTVSDTAPGEPAPAKPPEAAPPRPSDRPELRPSPPQVVIEPADAEPDTQPTLAEAALRERQRRSNIAGGPTVVITDANLHEHAVGELTFMEDEVAEDVAPGTAEAVEEEGPDEQFWRRRVLEIRQRWAETAKEVPELEESVAELRRRFYEADDAYYRDTRIKPAWDRAIDLIAQTQAAAEAHRLELQEALAEGRLAGALPGWLREGVELEPAPLEPVQDSYEPGEPTIVEPSDGGGGS